MLSFGQRKSSARGRAGISAFDLNAERFFQADSADTDASALDSF